SNTLPPPQQAERRRFPCAETEQGNRRRSACCGGGSVFDQRRVSSRSGCTGCQREEHFVPPLGPAPGGALLDRGCVLRPAHQEREGKEKQRKPFRLFAAYRGFAERDLPRLRSVFAAAF